MFPRILFSMLAISLPALAPAAGAESVVETKYIDSVVLRDNLIGLQTRRSLKVYLPPGYAQGQDRYPMIYLLHSLNWSNERMFAPGTAAQPTFDRAIARGVIPPFIAVAPDYTTSGPGSFFADSPVSGRFEEFTLREVVPFIDANYRTLAGAASRGITGDQLGAYGAMRYAFRHPDVFGAVYGMHPYGSGAGIVPMQSRPDWSRIHAAKSYADLAGNPYSPVFVAMAQVFLPNPQRPPFYCDFLVEPRDGRLETDAKHVLLLKSRFFLEQIAEQNLDNLRKLRGIKFDWGRYDPNPDHVHSNLIFTRKLDELGIEHEAEEFRGLPWDQYWIDEGRVYTEVLPFFSRRLEWGHSSFSLSRIGGS
ncbi:MAG TPA: alpha/beta hydrolase-fold protein [Steroidobacteraceae bacterium]|nr:alpha/beta hydrolase-fold protein [Steroidobacteraceae bacterium]